ncbi:unnamed protein product [Chironomus riparius]|uniref:Elongation of very long chain fatty acids protein n=1 Tax=Chironomus riparius TaxID=315576 RepID=A0A9N9S485_9DIPT|nr:unnamed protein product [Chironomus riparius]
MEEIMNFNWTGKYFYLDMFPMMHTPYPILAIIAVYLIFVLKLGRLYMKDKPPFDLDDLLKLYNVFQVCCCTYIVLAAHFIHGYSFFTFSKCILSPEPVGEEDPVSLHLVRFHIDGYLFMLLRLLELIETVFFVLRKKYNQVSILHVYHHISTIVLCWLFLKYRGGRMEMFIAVINSYVHIIMYAYYFFSSYKRFFTVTNKIKPFITVIQIIQLFLILVQCIAITLCEKSSLNYAIVINFILNIILFSHFFIKAYLWKPKRRVENNNNNNNNPDAGKNRQIVLA